MLECICAQNSLNTEGNKAEWNYYAVAQNAKSYFCGSYYCCFGIRTNIYEFVITL